MKSASQGVVDAIRNDAAVFSSARVIAEWNQNRYAAIESITNGSTIDPDKDNFPIESIALPNRPERGVVKARSSSVSTIGAIGADGFTTRGYTDSKLTARYITASPDSKYKYWSSPEQSAGAASQIPAAIANCAPQIIYSAPVWTNKIVIGFESSYSEPSAYTIQITTDGTNWTTVGSNIAIPSNGRVIIYRQADGSWAQTLHREAPMQILGIKLVVTQMDKSGVYFNLIELSPRLESDLTDFVMGWGVNMEMSEHSFIAPFGKASSNGGSVSLSNVDQRFSNDNAASLYYKLLDKNVQFTIDAGITTSPYDSTSKVYEWIRMGTMFAEEWSGQNHEGTNVTLKDGSIHLQSIKPNPVFWEKMTAAEIIWRLLDSIGFSNYFYEKIDSDAATLVPYFWTDGDKTVWEIIEELAEAHQMAVYFDEYGILQIKTRNTAYNLAKTVSWQLNAAPVAQAKADIIQLEKSFDYEANTVEIGYKKTRISDENGGVPQMETVWEPEGTVTLRGSPLVYSMTNSQTYFTIASSDAKTWPFEGYVNIEGEFIKYNAKQYKYYLANNATALQWVKSEEERIALDKLNPDRSFMNYYTGAMQVERRGEWGSLAKAHAVDASGYLTRYRTYTGPVYSWAGGWIQQPQLGTVRMATNTTFTPNAWYVASRSTGLGTPPRVFGTRLRMTETGIGVAGLAMFTGSNDSGFFIEMIKTSYLNPTSLTYTYELCFYVKQANGTYKRIGPNGGKGVRLEVVPEKWYDLEAHVQVNGTTSTDFKIMVNGVHQMTVNVPAASYPVSGINSPNAGVFVRGYSHVDFEYLYASAYPETVTPDESTVFDRITGGYQSSQLTSELGYITRNIGRFIDGRTYGPIVTDRFTKLFFDDFGTTVHEVRRFDVKFSKAPVLHSRLYFSNETQAVCPEYNSNPFGAKFILANKYRQNAVISGEDLITFGADNPVQQQAMIYGRVVIQEDENTVTVTDDAGIRRRGESSVGITSDWIQSEGAAKSIGEWIKLHWGRGADEVTVEVFGNPLLQLGDVVSVNYPLQGMTASTHKYFIVSIDNKYEKGLSTSLTLRRAKI